MSAPMHQLCFDFAVPRRGLTPPGWVEPPDLPCVRCRKVGPHWTADCAKCRARRLALRSQVLSPKPALQRVPCASCKVMGWWRDGERCAYCKPKVRPYAQG